VDGPWDPLAVEVEVDLLCQCLVADLHFVPEMCSQYFYKQVAVVVA